jgi:hypothetical protein
MAFTPRSAKNAKTRINGVVLTTRKWVVTPKTTKIDTSNHEGGGWAENITGLVEMEIQITFHPDATANPYDAPRQLTPGTRLTNVMLYLNDVTGPFWQIPMANVIEHPMTADVKDALDDTITLAATGSFIYPTGAF